MLRQNPAGDLANLTARRTELERAAEDARRRREATQAPPRIGRARAATASALRALLARLDPAPFHERQLGRDAGC